MIGVGHTISKNVTTKRPFVCSIHTAAVRFVNESSVHMKVGFIWMGSAVYFMFRSVEGLCMCRYLFLKPTWELLIQEQNVIHLTKSFYIKNQLNLC